MSWGLVADLALAGSAVALWWVGWETRSPEAASRSRVHRAVELHLALWLYFALASAAAVGAGGLRAAWLAAPVVVLCGLLAGGILAWGARAGRERPLPRAATWFLAPLRGLSLWLLLAYEALSERQKRWARPAEPTRGEEEPTSPRSLRESVREFDSLTLEEIMVPRSLVVALSGDRTPRQLLPRIRQYRHSLYPVHGDSVDHLLGVVRMLDLARAGRVDRPVRELVVTAPIVPETLRGLAMLGQMAGSQVTSALVVDEFGSHAGLVTMEDLVEVLVGDLAGEHEVVRKRILSLGPGRYRVEGTCKIEEFNDEVEEVLPEGEYETVAGLFLEHSGRIPQPGDEVRLKKAHLEVEQATDRRILWLLVTLGDRPVPVAS